MTSSKSHAWYIDALDARAGMAFAAYRSASADDAPLGPVETPAAFIGAPDFTPVRLASRVLALSATRGLFQPGLYVSDTEMPFETLDSVAEFVRRAYLRGGGEDGPDRGGGSLPPRLPLEPNGGNDPGGPDKRPTAEAERESSEKTKDALSAAEDALARPGADEGSGAAWFRALRAQISMMAVDGKDKGDALRVVQWVTPVVDGEDSDQRVAEIRSSLERAGQALLAELQSRLPKTSERSIWLRSAESLGSALYRIGMLGEGEALIDYLHRLDGSHEWWSFGRGEEDPLDLLEALPAPPSISDRMGLAEAASLLDVLSAFFGAPVDDPATLDLVLFASFLIVHPRRSLIAFRRRKLPGPQDVAAALEWLGQQLPRQLYSQSVEGALRNAGTSPT